MSSQIIKVDKEVKENFEHTFNILESGLYIVEIIASAKSWRQNLKEWRTFFNDDDLAVKINGIEFLKLNGKGGLFDGEAAWNGNNLKGLKKIGIFVLNLKAGDNKIEFIADKRPYLESIKIEKVSCGLESPDTGNVSIEYVPSDENKQAQDGNNRQWINLVFADLPIKEIAITAKAEKREKDNDDIKLIIDGEIQKNKDLEYFKNWYWAGSLDDAAKAADTEKFGWKEFKKEVNLPKGLHYIELWADKMPVLENIKLVLETKQGCPEQDQQKGLFGKIALYKDLTGLNYANFRSSAAKNDNNLIAEIKNGEEVEILEKEVKGEYIKNFSDIWHKIKYGGLEGYVLSSFIEISGQERNVIVEKIKEKADELELDKKLLIAIAFQESKFKPFAVSYTGVQGVFQITNNALIDVAKKTGYEITDRFDFKQSIEAGLRYYKYVIIPCFDKNDKQYLEKTIAAYNAGYNKIPHGKNEKLVYKKLDITEVKKIEVEKYAKSILKNYQDKNWIKKLFIIILIFAVFSASQSFYSNKINYTHDAVAVDAHNGNKHEEKGKNIIELYNTENNMDENGFIDKIFKIELDNKENTLKIKENRDLIDGGIEKETKIFFNDKELLSNQEGLKDILLWKAHNILIARFWGGQTVYNYLFDLKNGGVIIPFVGDGKTDNFAESAGGSWIGEIPIFGEVFFLYYEGIGLCDGAGEIYQLYGDLDGLKMIKLWNMKESKDWCDNFNG
ncbi:MAG: transglycosylase SLT domain-containing protein [bacterium]